MCKVKEPLCICNMCGTVLIDTNPQKDAPTFEVDFLTPETIYFVDEDGAGIGCPNCHTDSYLMDIEEENNEYITNKLKTIL